MNNRLAIGILNDYQHAALSYADWSEIQKRCELTVIDRPVDANADINLLRSFDILCIMRERTPFPRTLFEKLPRLRLLITTAEVNAVVDLGAAKDHGVLVCGTGNGDGRRTTAELTWGLIISATRGISEEIKAVQEGRWQVGVGTGLWGRTLGLVGLGHLGSMMSAYGRAFGMNVIAWSPNLTKDRASSVGAHAVSREVLFSTADVISVHLILSDRNFRSIGAAEFGLMKPSAIFVNTSRGPLVDEEALLAAIDSGQIRGAALDTFCCEPLPLEHPFRGHPRIIATPHIGYVESDVYKLFFNDTVAAINAYLDGRTPAIVLQMP